MTVGVVLLLYATVAGTLGARALTRSGWAARAPLLAIAICLTAAWSVIAALGLAGLTLAVHATALGGGLSHLIGACVLRLRALYATPGGATVAGLGLTLTGSVAARAVVSAATLMRASGRQASRHADMARMLGTPSPALGAVLVAHPHPTAYCVAGRRPTVVLTTGAAEVLAPDQLASVLAHEKAHLSGHHHHLLALARIARQVLPFLPLTREAEAQVARLVELHADDAARQVSGPGPLAAALVLLATVASPAAALAASATDTVQRVRRLLDPAPPLDNGRRRLLRATAALVACTPVLIALAPAGLALALGRVPGT